MFNNDSHFVIQPTITFWGGDGPVCTTNALDEMGRPVDQCHEYNSDRNEHFLSIPEIIKCYHLGGLE